MTKPTPMTALTRLRESAGMSRRALAIAAGIDPGTLGHYEAGTKRPGLDALVRLADVLGCTLDALAGRENNSAKSSAGY